MGIGLPEQEVFLCRFILPGTADEKTETGSPRLLYVCKLDGTELMYPRSAHTHSGLVEFVYVISGQESMKLTMYGTR